MREVYDDEILNDLYNNLVPPSYSMNDFVDALTLACKGTGYVLEELLSPENSGMRKNFIITVRMSGYSELFEYGVEHHNKKYNTKFDTICSCRFTEKLYAELRKAHVYTYRDLTQANILQLARIIPNDEYRELISYLSVARPIPIYISDKVLLRFNAMTEQEVSALFTSNPALRVAFENNDTTVFYALFKGLVDSGAEIDIPTNPIATEFLEFYLKYQIHKDTYVPKTTFPLPLDFNTYIESVERTILTEFCAKQFNDDGVISYFSLRDNGLQSGHHYNLYDVTVDNRLFRVMFLHDLNNSRVVLIDLVDEDKRSDYVTNFIKSKLLKLTSPDFNMDDLYLANAVINHTASCLDAAELKRTINAHEAEAIISNIKRIGEQPDLLLNTYYNTESELKNFANFIYCCFSNK